MARLGRRTVIAGTVVVAVAGALGIGAAAAERTDRPTPAEVEATQRTLDARAGAVPDSVVSWGIDPAVGLVVVGVRGARDGAVDRFLAGVDPRTYRVESGTAPARTLPGATPGG